MPQATIKRNTSPSVRNPVDRRKEHAKQGRAAGDRAATPAPAVIADSIFTLTVVAKPGVAVHQKMKGKRLTDNEDDYEKMYRDLLRCLHHALKLVGEESAFDPLASGLDLSVSVYYVLNCFKSNILPKGYDVNIDKDDTNGYYFTIFKECGFNAYWHCFEFKPILDKVKDNPKLYDLYLEVINCMMSKAGIYAWWNGGMGYAEYMLEEHVADWDANYEFDTEEESMLAYQEAVATLDIYNNGEAQEYQTILRETRYREPKDLLKSLHRLRYKNKIVKWLIEACEFLLLPGNINDFIYPECEDLEGLKFDQHIAIIWQYDDEYTRMQAECLDSEAQGIGVNGPIINLPVTTQLKSLDFDELKEREKWPARLSKLYQSHNTLVNSFKPKKLVETFSDL